MAFESLSDKLQNIFKNLRSKGRLTEDDVKASLKEVKMALLEADVSFKVVKQFVNLVDFRPDHKKFLHQVKLLLIILQDLIAPLHKIMDALTADAPLLRNLA